MSSFSECPHHDAQVVRFTWACSINTQTDSFQNMQDSGPMCMACAALLNRELERFTTTYETLTIHPVPKAKGAP